MNLARLLHKNYRVPLTTIASVNPAANNETARRWIQSKSLPPRTHKALIAMALPIWGRTLDATLWHTMNIAPQPHVIHVMLYVEKVPEHFFPINPKAYIRKRRVPLFIKDRISTLYRETLNHSSNPEFLKQSWIRN